MYLDFYGLKENPFNVTSDPSFLYLSNTHKEAIDHIKYGIDHKKGFLEITGEVGAGKTTLCRALMNQFDHKVKTALIFNSNLSEIQLLEAIVNDFGIKPKQRNKVALLNALNEFLLEQLKYGNNSVLIIDEAQNLKSRTLETIRMLSNLETEKEKLLQIVLVGQPELREKLLLPRLRQLRQRIAVRYHLNTLDSQEIRNYIDHRLQIAGPPETLFFQPEAIDKIYDYSCGIPRIVNILCDKVLLLGFVQETFSIDRTIVEKSIEELEGNFNVAKVVV